MNTSIKNIDPEIMNGVPVFRGTRDSIQTLFNHLENGKSLDDFLEGFPSSHEKMLLQSWNLRSQ